MFALFQSNSSLFPLKYSLCNEPLIELSNPGASGSIFYVSSDDEFIIKTVQHKEAEFLQKLLPGYFMVSLTAENNGKWECIRIRGYYCSIVFTMRVGGLNEREL